MKRIGFVLALAALIAGCAAGPKRVECAWRLEPINAPAPAAKQSPEHTRS